MQIREKERPKQPFWTKRKEDHNEIKTTERYLYRESEKRVKKQDKEMKDADKGEREVIAAIQD